MNFFYAERDPIGDRLDDLRHRVRVGLVHSTWGPFDQLPREKVGLASGTILTIMIMAGNTAVVTMAMIIDLYPRTKAGEAIGVQYGYLYSALIALLGLILAVMLLGTRGQRAVTDADDTLSGFVWDPHDHARGTSLKANASSGQVGSSTGHRLLPSI